MRTKDETMAFLDGLQWQRMTKNELQKMLRDFFDSRNFIEEATDDDDKDIDYSIIFTTRNDTSVSGFIDIEIFYLKMRNGNILITGVELLDYVG